MKPMSQFSRDDSGNSAVEFAFLAPVLALVCLGIINGWSLASFSLNMRAAVGSAANLYMQGAGDDDLIKAQAIENWQGRTADAAIAVSRAYKCGEVTVEVAALCEGSKAPATYVTLRATGTWVAPFEVDFLGTRQQIDHQQVIRVR